jgi:hypothetical protein
MIKRASAVAVAWQVTNRMRLRMLMHDDVTMPGCLCLVYVLRRYEGHESKGGRVSQ